MGKTRGIKGKSFVVRIYYTEHSTWQGRIDEVSTGKVQNSQSCLELIKMIDEHFGIDKREIACPQEERNSSDT